MEANAQWLAIGVTVFGLVANIAYSYGTNGKAVMEQAKRIDDLEKKSAEHERMDHLHFSNTDVHWTARERDALQRTLNDLSLGMKELLDRSGQRRKGDLD